MHPVLFSMKRAYWRSQLAMRPLFDVEGMTPARFDLMHAVAHCGPSARQTALPQVLGCHPMTVSRMLASLEKLGFVVRDVDTGDRRKKHVELTKLGWCVLRHLVRCILRKGAARKLVKRMLGTSSRALLGLAVDLDGRLRSIEAKLGGMSWWIYEWPRRASELLRRRRPELRAPFVSG